MIKKIVFALCTMSMLYADYDGGNHDMGQTYYRYILKPMLGYGGQKFTTSYTQLEWRALFDNNATRFKEKFGVNPQMVEFLNSEKFEKIAPHLKAFAIYYSLDSGYVPKCGDDKREDK